MGYVSRALSHINPATGRNAIAGCLKSLPGESLRPEARRLMRACELTTEGGDRGAARRPTQFH